MRGKSAWLITWEDLGFKHWGENEPKVVAVLPSRTPLRVVEEIVAALWTATEDLTLSERVAYGLLDKRENRALLQKVDGDHFYWGLKPKLYVRKVSNLRCKTKGRTDVLSWVETPIWTIDPKTEKPMTREDTEVKVWSQRRP